MKASFPYKVESSHIFGLIRRPTASVSIWSPQRDRWLTYTMIVDTGADYTLLPYSASEDLKLDLEKDARELRTFGIGGSETVYLLKNCKIKIGKFELVVPLGFLARDNIPPLLGRQQCLDRFGVLFSQFITTFNTL
jgi:predicted aspartyl protease